ncbi:50S ribosomal protein L13 [soil metagenome]
MRDAIKNSIRTTKYATKSENPENWYVVDATDKVLGRLSSEIAKRVRGKASPMYTPNSDMGDNIIVINAEKVRVTGKRAEQKDYKHHSLYPGGQKIVTYKEMLAKHPERIIEKAVRRMLPKTRLGNKIISKLKVYTGSEHPHAAQNPKELTLKF